MSMFDRRFRAPVLSKSECWPGFRRQTLNGCRLSERTSWTVE